MTIQLFGLFNLFDSLFNWDSFVFLAGKTFPQNEMENFRNFGIDAAHQSETLFSFRVARWYIFIPKLPMWKDVEGPLNVKCWYILAIWNI
jgi:hypothetical protein